MPLSPSCLPSPAWSCELGMETFPSCGSLAASGTAHPRCGQPRSWGCCPARAGGQGSVAASSPPAVLLTGSQALQSQRGNWERLSWRKRPSHTAQPVLLPPSCPPGAAVGAAADSEGLVPCGTGTPEPQGGQRVPWVSPGPSPPAHSAVGPPCLLPWDRVLRVAL